MFPSLPAITETTSFSWMSVSLVMGLSYLAYALRVRWSVRRLVVIALVVLLFPHKIRAYSGVAGGCGTLCLANRNYYSMPFGNWPVYAWPQMPFPSFASMPFTFLPSLGGCLYCGMMTMPLMIPMGFTRGAVR